MGGPRDQYSTPATAIYQSWGPDEDVRLDKVLFAATAINLTVNQDARFVVRTPSVRCNLRLALLVAMAKATSNDPAGSGLAPLSFDNATGYALATNQLWICKRAHYRTGGWDVPTADVVGTRPAPQIIPVNSGLYGFEIEIQTSGEELYGVFTVPALSAVDGITPQSPGNGKDWHIVARYSSTVPLTEAEYNRARQGAEIIVLTGEGKLLK